MSQRAETSPLSGVDRALAVLEALAQAGPRGATLGELAGALAQNKATVHRALGALRHRDFAAQDAQGRYTLGPAAIALSAQYVAEQNLPALVAPALARLSGVTQELVHLGVLAGTQVVYLDKVEPELPVRVWSQVGSRQPAATTALGRAILAFQMDARGVAAWAQAAGLDADAAARLERATSAAVQAGFAQEVEENEPGIACVAVPVLRAGTAVAAISITAPVERMDAARRADVGALMLRTLPDVLPSSLTSPRP